MLKRLATFMAFGILISNAVFSQKNNRIAIQTNFLYCFFDSSPTFNSRFEGASIFKSRIVDSRGIEIMRKIKRSRISVDYNVFNSAYNYQQNYDPNAKLQYIWKQLKFASAFYARELNLKENWKFTYGVGGTYSCGDELFFHYTSKFGWFAEGYATGYNRKDLGISVRSGIEYTPIKWITIFSDVNFLGNVYHEDDIKPNDPYKIKINEINAPSKVALSLRLGVGFNFLK